MERILYKFQILAGFILSGYTVVNAQIGTSYYMAGIPQSYTLNPATQPNCTFFLGFPVLSSVYVSAYNSAFNFDDVIYKDKETDSLITPFHSTDDMNKFLEKFDDINYVTEAFTTHLFSMGFRARDMFFSLDVANKNSLEITYPKDLVTFLFTGNGNGQNFDFSDIAVDFNDYVEIDLGISKRFSDMFYVGIRPKLLLGQANVSTTNTQITLATSADEWAYNSHNEVNVSATGIILPNDATGILDLMDGIKFDSSLSNISKIQKAVLANKGFGIDLGLHYYLNPQFELSASVVDLGFIKWSNYSNTITLNRSFTFSGVDISPGDTSNFVDKIVDSLKAGFEMTSVPETYTTYLSPKVFIGGRYFLLPNFDVGAISRFEFHQNSKIRPSLTLLANWRPSSVLGVTASYGLFTPNSLNLGIGITFHLGPLNFYLVSNSIPTTYKSVANKNIIIPENMNQASVHFGLNLVFGTNHVKKLLKDKPMYYSDEY